MIRRNSAAALAALLLAAASAIGQTDAARRMLIEAQRQLASGNETAALGELQAIVSSFPGTPAAAQALVETAQLHLDKGRTAEVTAVTDKLIAEYARLPETATGIVLQAEARRREARSVAELEEIRTLLRRVGNMFPATTHPDLQARARARTLSAEIDLLDGRFAAAAGELLETIEAEPASEARTRAHVDLATTLLLDPTRDETSVLGAIQSLQAAIDDQVSGESDNAHAARARDLLTLLHRTWLRPRSGQAPWQRARVLEGVALRKPRGVAGGPGGLLVVTDAASAIVVGGDGKVLATTPLREPARPSVGADGTALLVAAADIQEYPSKRTETFAFLREKLQELDKLATASRGPFGEWLIFDRGLGAVAVLSREERSLRELPPTRSEVVDMAVGPLGRIYVLVDKEPRVLVYGPSFQQVQAMPANWQRPEALDVDAVGNVYVLDRGARTIDVRDRAGAVIATLGPTLPGGLTLRSPEDVAVDGRGRILVLDGDVPGVIAIE